MTSRVYLSEPAWRYLDAILKHVIEHGGQERAVHVIDRLRDAFTKLADHPGLGHRREDLTHVPLRFWNVWSYLIIYKPETKPLKILRVLHGARDLRTTHSWGSDQTDSSVI